MEQVTAHILIEGRVQGVGYRYFTLQNGQHLGLFGWVCNLTDGRVEVLCQGSKQNIDLLVEKTKTRPISFRCHRFNMQNFNKWGFIKDAV